MSMAAEPHVVRLHEEVNEYAIHVNTAIAEVRERRREFPLAGGALLSIRADHLALHRSVLSLCREGLALSVTPILRTMLELMISTAVIVTDHAEAEYRGFKYTHVFFKANLNNEAFPEEQRRRMREQIEEGLALLPASHRDKARGYVFKERTSPYWYFPEFRRPAEAIDELCPADVAALYSLFSAGSHGGYLGLRILKDRPDDIHPNPRRDKRSQDFALVASMRLTLEVFRGSDRFEASGVSEEVTRVIFDRFRALEPLLRPS